LVDCKVGNPLFDGVVSESSSCWRHFPTMPTMRKCPLCDFETENEKIKFCPEHGQKLVSPQDEVRFFDAFISYRRESGEDRAGMLKAVLSNPHGLNVFRDTEELNVGEAFPQRLEEIIAKTPNFILVLTPGALDRCRNEGDWLRREIATALRTRRTIIPVSDKRFVWPKAAELPEDIRALVDIHSTPYDHQFLDASIDKIVAIVRKNLGERPGSPRAAEAATARASSGATTVTPVASHSVGPDLGQAAAATEWPRASSGPTRPTSVPMPGQNWTVPGLDIEMIWIEPGSFVMGSPEGETGRSGDETQHRVTLTKGFWLGKYPVTQRQWQELMGNNPSYFVNGRVLKEGGWFSDAVVVRDATPECPVEQVSWEEAVAFGSNLNDAARAHGGLPPGYAYGLPTEAQWEYACRAGTDGPYGGTRVLDGMGWYDGNSGSRTHPVGQKKPNAWGLYDMHGNVWEWCRDWYTGTVSGEGVVDPTGPSSGAYRVNRGGGWRYAASSCRSANRDRSGPGGRSVDLGFRLALSSVP